MWHHYSNASNQDLDWWATNPPQPHAYPPYQDNQSDECTGVITNYSHYLDDPGF